jgi:hypothetical protein
MIAPAVACADLCGMQACKPSKTAHGKLLIYMLCKLRRSELTSTFAAQRYQIGDQACFEETVVHHMRSEKEKAYTS